MKLAYHPLRWCACFFCLLAIVTTSCGRKANKLPQTTIDSINFTSLTSGVETLISDSGVTKYKLKADLWYTYDTPERMWYFPEGIYLEQFDTLFNIEASVQADTAYYYQARKLWELKENIRIQNREGQQFYAINLFWDEVNKEIYSHEPIRIIRTNGEMLESQYGFKSNETMTKYELYTSSGHLDVKEEANRDPDSLTNIAPPATAPIVESASRDTVSQQKPQRPKQS